MILFGINTRRLFNSNIRLVGVPAALLVVLIVLFGFLIKVGYGQVTSQIEEFKAASEREQKIEEKVQVLRQMQNQGLDSADLSVIVLPDKNPGFIMVSQLRAKAQDNDLVLSDIKLTQPREFKEGITQMQLTAEIQSEDLDSLTALFRDFQEVAPIFSMDKVLLSAEREAFTAELNMIVYWSEFPGELPAITEPINTLTQEERNILSRLSQLEQPQFTELSPSQPRERQNPFN